MSSLPIWFLLLCGLVAMAFLLHSLYLGLSSSSWPTTTGRVLKSEIQTKRNPASSGTIAYYHPVVVYEYRVGGKRVVSKRLGNYLAFGERLEEAESLVARFPLGSDVRVYYHPRLSRVAALMPGMKQPLIHAILGFTATIIVYSAGLAVFADNPFALIEIVFRLVGERT